MFCVTSCFYFLLRVLGEGSPYFADSESGGHHEHQVPNGFGCAFSECVEPSITLKANEILAVGQQGYFEYV